MADIEQIQPKESSFPFVQRPEYEEEHKQEIILVLFHFVKIAIGEGDEIRELVPDLQSLITGSENAQSESSDKSSSSNSLDMPDNPPFIIIFDNAHLMDAASWDLYEAVRDGCYRLVLIMML